MRASFAKDTGLMLKKAKISNFRRGKTGVGEGIKADLASKKRAIKIEFQIYPRPQAIVEIVSTKVGF